MKCPYCFAEIPDGTNKCDYCGSSLSHYVALQNDGTFVKSTPNYDANRYGIIDKTDYSLKQAYGRFFSGYFKSRGRANKSEFWNLWAVQSILCMVLTLLTGLLLGLADDVADLKDTQVLFGILFGANLGLIVLATAIPMLMLTLRRLHDAGLGGGYVFLSLVPFGGFVVMTVLCAIPSNNDRFSDGRKE